MTQPKPPHRDAPRGGVTHPGLVRGRPQQVVTWLTAADAAVALGVSKMTVYRLIQAGSLEAVRVGRSLRIQEAEVRRYVREHSTLAS